MRNSLVFASVPEVLLNAPTMHAADKTSTSAATNTNVSVTLVPERATDIARSSKIND